MLSKPLAPTAIVTASVDGQMDAESFGLLVDMTHHLAERRLASLVLGIPVRVQVVDETPTLPLCFGPALKACSAPRRSPSPGSGSAPASAGSRARCAESSSS